jgi:protein-tyrosine phosphatase
MSQCARVVRGLVCSFDYSCLDDEELRYLGAPWEEYSSVADGLSLDILRFVLHISCPQRSVTHSIPSLNIFSIPVPEGLAPADVKMLDEHLTRLIETYTLRGVAILVHCRGGVGRAGLIACCWALKLGLCGWIETQPGRSSRLSFTAPEDLSQMSLMEKAVGVRRDTIQLVERVITFVRKRRSAKAIETFEQVKFLVEYVEFLRRGASVSTGEVGVGSMINRDIRTK